MTCYTGQVFLLGLKLGRSEDWFAVCGRAHAQTGFKMASQTQTFNSSSPSHQWGNLLRMVTRCQSGRSIRNWFELNWKLIELLFLNWKLIELLFLDWIELKLFIELNNWTPIWTWTWIKVLYFYFHIEFICLNVMWNICGPLWLMCKLKVFSYL